MPFLVTFLLLTLLFLYLSVTPEDSDEAKVGIWLFSFHFDNNAFREDLYHRLIISYTKCGVQRKVQPVVDIFDRDEKIILKVKGNWREKNTWSLEVFSDTKSDCGLKKVGDHCSRTLKLRPFPSSLSFYPNSSISVFSEGFDVMVFFSVSVLSAHGLTGQGLQWVISLA